MKLIEQYGKHYDENYDLHVRNIQDIRNNNCDLFSMIFDSFKFGYMQGMKATKAQMGKAVDSMEKQLVILKGNDVFTDSLIIAEGTGNQHESVQRRIREYEKEICTFGKLGFKIRPMESGQEQKIYQLNEMQATFLITLLRNTVIVVEFKMELVRQFYAMRQFIFERQTKGWNEVREQGKLIRKEETDVLKRLVESARKQGYDHEDKLLYINYIRLANKICGIDERDNASSAKLSNLTVAENIILHCIQAGIDEGKYYKDIYQDCKKRLEMFKDIAYLEVA